MAKLHFFHSVMNAGKSTHLLAARHNYVENGGFVICMTSARDDRCGVGRIASRMGLEAEATPIGPSDDLLEIVRRAHAERPVTALLIDEVQFFEPAQVWQMSDVVDRLDVPVMAYGLKNNAFGELFSPAIGAMLALANDVNEIKQVCHCGAKATMILRFDATGNVARGGEVVETGGENRYVSVCRKHWKAGDIGPKARRTLGDGANVRVTCRTCGTSFESLFGDPEQSHGCAAEVLGRSVRGWYGSAVADMSFFEFSEPVPGRVGQGLICDDCLRGFIADGSLRSVSGGGEVIAHE